MIKFQKNIQDYKYVLSFDLAKRVSGYSLWDFKTDKVLLCGVIDTKNAAQQYIWDYFYNEVLKVISDVRNILPETGRNLLFVTKERLPNQNGKFSTIDALQGLAQAHAIFDLAISHSNIDIYDWDGVHSISVRAYFKKITRIDKPQKEDIACYIKNKFDYFDFDKYTYDVTDSLAVSITLLGCKYNSDLQEKIKEIRRELKTAKAQAKIYKLKNELEFLQNLIIDIQ